MRKAGYGVIYYNNFTQIPLVEHSQIFHSPLAIRDAAIPIHSVMYKDMPWVNVVKHSICVVLMRSRKHHHLKVRVGPSQQIMGIWSQAYINDRRFSLVEK